MKKILKTSLFIGGIAGTGIALNKRQDVNNIIKEVERKLERNENQKVYELRSSDYPHFPWTYKNSIDEDHNSWEFRKIKLNGTLLKSRFFVAKERRGQKGFLVFGGLKTSRDMGKIYPSGDVEKFYAKDKGIVICLGWVPADKYKYGLKDADIETVKPFEEKENLFGECYDHNRGHLYLSYSEDDPREGTNTDELRVINELQEVEGFLRKSEKRDVLLGKTNDDISGYFSRVDLRRMAGFFKFANIDSEEFYLERAVPNLEDSGDLDLLPIPTSFQDTLKHVEDYEKNSIYDRYKKIMYASPLLAAIGFLI